MTADLAQACADLKAWTIPLHQLITQPDTDGTTSHAKPGSRPPWNQAAANTWTDIHAGVRDLEQTLRYRVSGRITIRGGSDANTLRAIDAIDRLAAGADQHVADAAAQQIERWVTTILQLPAVDLEERPRRIEGICSACGRCMVSTYLRDGKVACLGCGLKGQIRPGTVSDGFIEWEDGTIT